MAGSPAASVISPGLARRFSRHTAAAASLMIKPDRFSSNGLQRSREAYTGLFEVKLVPPTNEADAFNNPLGLFVTNFSWSREYASPPMAVPTAGAAAATPAGGTSNQVNGSRNQR